MVGGYGTSYSKVGERREEEMRGGGKEYGRRREGGGREKGREESDTVKYSTVL